MSTFSVKHQEADEDLDNKEVVGSTDLREAFKEGARVRGTFSLNNVEFTNFESGSPAQVVSLINEKADRSGVTASVDDNCHLVLENSSPSDIKIALGAAYVEPVRASSVADEVVAKLKADQDQEKPTNNVLEMLGLEANDDADGAPARPGFETGQSADDRQKGRDGTQRAPVATADGKNEPHPAA